MSRHAWPTIVLLWILGCSSPEELPEVKTLTPSDHSCTDAPRAIVSIDAVSAQMPDIGVCVQAAWASRCAGEMSFVADVDESGLVTATHFEGDVSPQLRACINHVLKGAMVLKPLDCPGVTAHSSVSGGISWPKDGGTYVHFGGDSGILPCLRQCSEGDLELANGCG